MKTQIKSLVLQAIKSPPETEIGDGDDLYRAGLKSLSAARLLLSLEREFDVEFPESALTDGSLESIDRIEDLVTAHRGQGAGA